MTAPLLRISRRRSILLLAAACVPRALRAQSHSAAAPPPGTDPTTGAPPLFADSSPPDPSQVHMLREMAKERNVLRQKEIVDDTDQLLDLAKQLKDAVDKSSKDELSLSVVDTAAEIEKLARSVKEKMRDGQ